jgi:DNA-binding IclR family transcriptional regulator
MNLRSVRQNAPGCDIDPSRHYVVLSRRTDLVGKAMRQNITRPAKPRQQVAAAERALLILKCFDDPGERLSLAALAQRTELYKSTILRLSASLGFMGFLKRTADGHYMLGPELSRLGRLALSQPRSKLEDAIRPVLHRLVNTTKETASFYVIAGSRRICMFRENSLQPARHHLEEGTLHPLSRGAASQVLRAYRKEPRDKKGRSIRQAGWAISEGARHPDVSAVAVPVLNDEGQLIGALNVSGLRARLTPTKLERARRALVKESAMLRQILS